MRLDEIETSRNPGCPSESKNQQETKQTEQGNKPEHPTKQTNSQNNQKRESRGVKMEVGETGETTLSPQKPSEAELPAVVDANARIIDCPQSKYRLRPVPRPPRGLP